MIYKTKKKNILDVANRYYLLNMNNSILIKSEIKLNTFITI